MNTPNHDKRELNASVLHVAEEISFLRQSVEQTAAADRAQFEEDLNNFRDQLRAHFQQNAERIRAIADENRVTEARLRLFELRHISSWIVTIWFAFVSVIFFYWITQQT